MMEESLLTVHVHSNISFIYSNFYLIQKFCQVG